MTLSEKIEVVITSDWFPILIACVLFIQSSLDFGITYYIYHKNPDLFYEYEGNPIVREFLFTDMWFIVSLLLILWRGMYCSYNYLFILSFILGDRPLDYVLLEMKIPAPTRVTTAPTHNNESAHLGNPSTLTSAISVLNTAERGAILYNCTGTIDIINIPIMSNAKPTFFFMLSHNYSFIIYWWGGLKIKNEEQTYSLQNIWHIQPAQGGDER